jgi:hypothetical protein
MKLLPRRHSQIVDHQVCRQRASGHPGSNLRDSQQLRVSARGSNQVDKGDARFDYYVNDKVNFWARYSDRLSSPTTPTASLGPPEALPFLPAHGI